MSRKKKSKVLTLTGKHPSTTLGRLHVKCTWEASQREQTLRVDTKMALTSWGIAIHTENIEDGQAVTLAKLYNQS